jgi:hypothetical protein
MDDLLQERINFAHQIARLISPEVLPDPKVCINLRGSENSCVMIERTLDKHRARLVFTKEKIHMELLNGCKPDRFKEDKELVCKYEYWQDEATVTGFEDVVRLLMKKPELSADDLITRFYVLISA